MLLVRAMTSLTAWCPNWRSALRLHGKALCPSRKKHCRTAGARRVRYIRARTSLDRMTIHQPTDTLSAWSKRRKSMLADGGSCSHALKVGELLGSRHTRSASAAVAKRPCILALQFASSQARWMEWSSIQRAWDFVFTESHFTSVTRWRQKAFKLWSIQALNTLLTKVSSVLRSRKEMHRPWKKSPWSMEYTRCPIRWDNQGMLM